MRTGKLAPLVMGLSALLLAACAGQAPCSDAPGEAAPLETARLYVEYNFTDEDLGVHGAFDGTGWSELCVYDPDGNLVLAVDPQSQLNDLAMGGIFFESREPPTDEFTFDDLRAAFPEGEYEVRGTSFDGKGLSGAATFTHNVPAAPVILAPALAEDEESAGDALVSGADLVVEWEHVTEVVSGGPAAITAYEVIVTKENHDDPNGFSRPIFDVHLPPDRTSLAVPAGFLEPDTVYELEVLALEESGNQTISVGFFQTE